MIAIDIPSLEIENSYYQKGYKVIAGIDEAGRGPIAGPVVAAAVIINKNDIPFGINDSKKLSAKKREQLYCHIMQNFTVGIGVTDVERIDSINILNATKYSMVQACRNLKIVPNLLLIDGNFSIDIDIEKKSIVKGDTKSISIAAASIVAKVVRDKIMYKFANLYKDYHFEHHQGYPTRKHLEIVKQIGICPIHRKSFSPISNLSKK